jgi:hypothetical protein
MANKNSVLIVISIPFWRNARYLISSQIYKELKGKYDLLLVGPMCDQKPFQEEFGGKDVSFYNFNESEEHLNSTLKFLYHVSEALRRLGYYFRNRKGKMKYYWNSTIDPSNSDKNKTAVSSKIYKYKILLLGIFGYFKYTWRILDYLFGSWIFDTCKIYQSTDNYKYVVLVQTANWGYQERFLAYFSRKYTCRTILVPYTTDQTTINGYMISDFDKICAQGPIEKYFLTQLHDVPEEKITSLGMLWLRNYEFLSNSLRLKPEEKNKPIRKILYAGLAPDSFPRESEFLAINKIMESINNGVIPKAKLVYRPVHLNENEKYMLEQKYRDNNFFEIQLPQTSMIGISEKETVSIASEIESYIQQINDVDLMVMSATTTMAFEMWHKGVPCIANFTDTTGTLAKKGFTTSYIEQDAFLTEAKGMLISFTLEEMITLINISLKDPKNTAGIAASALSAWDYDNKYYIEDFIEIIEGLKKQEI